LRRSFGWYVDKTWRRIGAVERYVEPNTPDETAIIDENGVDRSQIRRLLALDPCERLHNLQEFMDAVEAIRALNGVHSV